MPDTYDYIIAGGGTCGPVVAGRLSEDPNLKVLIIESGSPSAELDDVQMPGAWTKCHYGETDWNIVSTPQAGLQNRECRLPRGRFLGGSSGSNGTICIRGVKQDYDDWGFPEWSGDEMFRAMKKSEKFVPKKWFPHEESAHGFDGPLRIEPAEAPFPIAHKMFESFQSKGLPYRPDMFSTGEAANGCGHAMRTTWKGSRTTAADYITKDYERKNVTIICHATVDKVILEKGADGELEAKGVEYLDNDGNRYSANASREVLLAGGTYCSPAMLMRSGIGPKEVLNSLNIPVQLDIPGVGQNLQDHQLIFMYYELSEPDLTDDARVNHDPDAYTNGHKEWEEKKSGWLSTFPFGAFGFARLADRLERDSEEWRNFPRREGRDPMDLTETQPNMEFFNTICYGGPPEYTDFPKSGEWAFSACTFLCGAMSRGEVKIKTTDPFEPPWVDPRYLSDRRDLLMMSEGVRFLNEVVMEGAGTKNIVKGGWPRGTSHHLNKTNEDWHSFVQKYASTSYHPGGTCKMGKAEDKTSVVDKYLRVHGCKNLRVVDCSIMPSLHSGHTQMPAFGIAEKVSEYIKQQTGGAKVTNGTNGVTNGSNGMTNGTNGVTNGANGVNGINGHH
ncbi:gmc oxidoreductase [Lecanosticta acicola]|uniref:Gmc oxidoreductase n=1 Tax=Lecanosticta acicola TaxID=111012 RepID=A0AAI8VUJ5_9PEZI|nr:gmc oxidoreductase [Lecanosticta acicola]